MPIYSKPSDDLVYDLINLSNPLLPTPVTKANVRLTAVTPIAAPTDFRNTTVEMVALPGGQYLGRESLKYRRLDLTKLFRGLVVKIKKYSPMQNANTNVVVFRSFDLLDAINAKYGLSLTEDDINDVSILRGTSKSEDNFYTSTTTITTKSTSKAWVGSFTLVWEGAPQGIDSLINVADITGLYYPGGDVFDEHHKKIIDTVVFDVDFSGFMTASPATSSSWQVAGTVGAGSAANLLQRPEVVSLLEQRLPGEDFSGFWWEGWSFICSNPAQIAPEANQSYDRVFLLKAPEAHATLVGTFYFHFFARLN